MPPDAAGEAPRNIVVSGLTAAGKTTHALLLAEELDYRYVSGVGVLARLCGISEPGDPPVWSKIADRVRAARTDDTDAAVEAELVRMSHEQTGLIFDAWALAWTSHSTTLGRIWIDSTLDSRAMKALVSGHTPAPDVPGCRSFIDAKDEADRDVFRRIFSFDLYSDHEHFDVILDNSAYIAKPTREAADRGVAAFAPIMLAAARYCRGEASQETLLNVSSQSPFGHSVIRATRRPAVA